MAKMPMSFTEFKKSCEAHGYTSRVSEIPSKNIYSMFTNNDIKTEIKPRWYTIGYGRAAEELDLLEDEMRSRGFHFKPRTSTYININFLKDRDTLEVFWEIVDIQENIDSIVAKARGIATKVFSREVADNSIFKKIALRYFNAYENQDQDLFDVARGLLSGDSIDHIITLGQSLNRTDDDTYREHIVPCIMIHNKAIDMVLNKASVVEVALMISTNLFIVLISNKEQELLDVTKGWRTTMPDGWKFGDNPLDRLLQAGIGLK